MADLSKCPPLTRASVEAAHRAIEPYIHKTPVLTCETLSNLASTSTGTHDQKFAVPENGPPAQPRMKLFFKCENYQRVGAFKARGAFHALSRLTDEELQKGVVTHSSGNHAAALALAAKTRGVPATIIMPHISTPSKIAATQGHGATVIFSGSTAAEREAVAAEVLDRTGGLLVPPYDHPDIMLGQGTAALEFEAQFSELASSTFDASIGGRTKLDAVITPCGGGGLLSGTAITLSGTGTLVFGAEPEFEGADDARRGLLAGERITKVSSTTIADGVRTPVGAIPWTIISDKSKVAGVFAVTEGQIMDAWRLLMERMKVFVEPTAALGLAVCLYNEEFRLLAERVGGAEGWNVGIILSGGNTTMEMIARAFDPHA